jgi:hypothetical protein
LRGVHAKVPYSVLWGIAFVHHPGVLLA